jgi:O-antigen/teichoic acid export membrane protein
VRPFRFYEGVNKVSSLRTKAVSGVLWTTGISVFRDFVQFGVMLVLVRLLAKEAYGEFGLVMAIMGFMSILSFRVFLEHTLQIRPGGEVDYQIHFTAGTVIQIGLFLCTNLVAEALKRFATYAPVAPLVHVMSFVFLLDVAHEFRVKMLEREMDWKRLRILQGIGVLANAILSLIMALAGAGVYALLVPSLLPSVPAIIDLFFVQRWRPTWKWDAAQFAPARKYGLTRLMSAVVGWSRPLMESAYLVQIAGYSAYGIYGRALGLAAMCCLKIPSLLTQALFPVLTKLDPGSGSSQKASALVFCSVAWTTYPIAILFSVLAAPVVHILYGARWEAAIPFLPWAMAAGAATALAQTGNILLIANLQPKRGFYVDGVVLVGTAVSLLLLAQRSLTLYLMGVAFVQTAAFLLVLVWLYRMRTIDLRGIANGLILPAICAATAFLGLELARNLVSFSRETVGGAILYGTAYCAIYALLLRVTSGQQCREVVGLLPGRIYLQRWLLLGT